MAFALAAAAHAQLWIESQSATTLQFVFKSVEDNLAIKNEYDSGAGARLTIALSDNPGGLPGFNYSLSITIQNLSGLNNTPVVGAPGGVVSFGVGTITNFGFSVEAPPFSFVGMNAVTGWVADTNGISGDGGTYDFDVGAQTSSGVNYAITSGNSKTFVFNFLGPTLDGNPLAPALVDLFKPNDKGVYFSFHFQQSANGGDSDKVAVVFDEGGGGFDNPVPEPSTYGLFGAMALLALVIARKRSR